MWTHMLPLSGAKCVFVVKVFSQRNERSCCYFFRCWNGLIEIGGFTKRKDNGSQPPNIYFVFYYHLAVTISNRFIQSLTDKIQKLA